MATMLLHTMLLLIAILVVLKSRQNIETHSLKTVVLDIDVLPAFKYNQNSNYTQFFESTFDPDFTIYVPDKSLEKYKTDIGTYEKYFRALSERPAN